MPTLCLLIKIVYLHKLISILEDKMGSYFPIKSPSSNYRWSEGLITPATYGMTITSLDDLNNKAHIKKLVKYAIEDGTREVFNEFTDWASLLKVKLPVG